MTIEQALNDPGFRSYAQQIGLAGKTGVPRAEAQAAVDDYLARQSEATQQATQVLDSVQPAAMAPNATAATAGFSDDDFGLRPPRARDPIMETVEAVDATQPAPQTQAQPQATTQQGLDPMTALRVFVEEDIAPKIGEWRGRYQQIADVAASGGFKSQAERGNRENEIDREIESLITELSLRDYWDPATQEMYKKQVDSGTPRVDAFTRSLDRIIRPSQGGTATAEATGMTTDDVINPDNIAKIKNQVGEMDTGVRMQEALLANNTRQQAIDAAYRNPISIFNAAKASVRYAQSEDIEAQDLFDKNALLVKEAYKAYEEDKPRRIALARDVLGEDAPEFDDLDELTGKITDTQRARLAKVLKENNVRHSPVAVVIQETGEGALSKSENFRRVQKARRLGVPVIEYGVNDKGSPTANQTLVSDDLLDEYAKRFAEGDGANRDELREQKIRDLNKIINDPKKSVIERANAEDQLFKVQEPVRQQEEEAQKRGPQQAREQERQALINDFNELFDLTVTGGPISGRQRNPALKDETFKESLTKLKELADQLGGMRDPVIRRRLPVVLSLQESLENPEE